MHCAERTYPTGLYVTHLTFDILHVWQRGGPKSGERITEEATNGEAGEGTAVAAALLFEEEAADEGRD